MSVLGRNVWIGDGLRLGFKHEVKPVSEKKKTKDHESGKTGGSRRIDRLDPFGK